VSRAERQEEQDTRAVRRVTSRAVRRLGVLEWVTLGVAALLAALGGALVAGLAAGPLGLAFRPTWVAASLLMFAVPALLALMKTRREERSLRDRSTNEDDGSHV
jgi:hypothetical protein